jgi:hypothetical protein
MDRGWWTDPLERNFGRTALGDEELDELLNSLPPVRRQSKAAKRNLLAGLRELHNCLVHGLERDWVEQRLVELQSRRRASPSPGAMGTSETAVAESQSTDGQIRRAAGTVAVRPGREFDRNLETKLGLSPGDMIRPELFPLEFDADQEPSLVVQAWFNPPLETLTRGQLLRFANLLKWRAAQLPTEAETPAAASTAKQRRRIPTRKTGV